MCLISGKSGFWEVRFEDTPIPEHEHDRTVFTEKQITEIPHPDFDELCAPEVLEQEYILFTYLSMSAPCSPEQRV